MDFLPPIVSAESSGPHANQTGCHSVSHFVQFHVLSPRKNYFDRLKPSPYWKGCFVSFLSPLVQSPSASQTGIPNFPELLLVKQFPISASPPGSHL